MRINKGFTLIELIVVISILTTLVIMLITAINPFEQIKKAQDTNVKNQMVEFSNSIVRYYTTHNQSLWSQNELCNNEIGDGNTLDNLRGCLTDLISEGELKPGFSSTENTLNKIYVSTCGVDVITCHKPQSLSQKRDPETKYDSKGAIKSGCPSLDNSYNDCFWCTQRNNCAPEDLGGGGNDGGGGGSGGGGTIPVSTPSATPMVSVCQTPEPTSFTIDHPERIIRLYGTDGSSCEHIFPDQYNLGYCKDSSGFDSRISGTNSCFNNRWPFSSAQWVKRYNCFTIYPFTYPLPGGFKVMCTGVELPYCGTEYSCLSGGCSNNKCLLPNKKTTIAPDISITSPQDNYLVPYNQQITFNIRVNRAYDNIRFVALRVTGGNVLNCSPNGNATNYTCIWQSYTKDRTVLNVQTVAQVFALDESGNTGYASIKLHYPDN